MDKPLPDTHHVPLPDVPVSVPDVHHSPAYHQKIQHKDTKAQRHKETITSRNLWFFFAPLRFCAFVLKKILSKRPLYICLLLKMSLLSNPWGKDADLVNFREAPSSTCTRKCNNSLLSTAAEKIITFHQEVISPADGPRSHYIPSSSQYMLDAIRKYGFAQGYCMGCDRLMRENNDPWVYRETVDGAGDRIKYDPVP